MDAAMNEWQDIATAPRDGTAVLVFAPLKLTGRPSRRARSEPRMVAAFHARWGWLSIPNQIQLSPTHYMDLPPPPENTA